VQQDTPYPPGDGGGNCSRQLLSWFIYTLTHRCPDAAQSDGTCADEFTMLASITRNNSDGEELQTFLCLPLPQYDLFVKSFWWVALCVCLGRSGL